MSEDAPIRRILLVEDDAAIREALIEVLVSLGYEVVSAPDGLRGLGLAAAQDRPCPVILSTGDRTATSAAVGDQVAGVLSKPFDLASLVAVLDRVSPRRVS